MAPARRLVVGLGNPLAGDDGFGGAVVDRLRALSDLPPGVDIRNAHTDLLSQIDVFADYHDVVLVDAVLGQIPGGRVAVFDEPGFSRWPEGSSSCHQVSPLLAVKLFRILHPEATTTITLVALCAERLVIGASLPDVAVTSGVETVLAVLKAG
jgi:hydrogenase maturation protease